MNRPLLLEAKGIVKSFGAVIALNNVDFYVDYGEVVGLVGDNGAGKSTLIKILAGYYQPDRGRIFFEGREVAFRSPAEARKLGIEVVYQHLALVPYMNIYRNMFLGKEIVKKFGFIKVLDKKRMKEEAKKMLKRAGIVKDLDVELSVDRLSGGERQIIAINRALHFGAKLLLLDEPTSALSVRECEEVLKQVLELKKKGVGCVIVSHNIYHVYSVADRIVVLDRGVKILDIPRDVASPQEIMDVIAHRLPPEELQQRVKK